MNEFFGPDSLTSTDFHARELFSFQLFRERKLRAICKPPRAFYENKQRLKSLQRIPSVHITRRSTLRNMNECQADIVSFSHISKASASDVLLLDVLRILFRVLNKLIIIKNCIQ